MCLNHVILARATTAVEQVCRQQVAGERPQTVVDINSYLTAQSIHSRKCDGDGWFYVF